MTGLFAVHRLAPFNTMFDRYSTAAVPSYLRSHAQSATNPMPPSWQVLGPVRGRMDVRFALDSDAPCPQGTALLRAGAPLRLAKHVGGLRPSLVETAYGLDVVVPGSSGMARVVAWYAPVRGEAMLQLCLL